MCIILSGTNLVVCGCTNRRVLGNCPGIVIFKFSSSPHLCQSRPTCLVRRIACTRNHQCLPRSSRPCPVVVVSDTTSPRGAAAAAVAAATCARSARAASTPTSTRTATTSRTRRRPPRLHLRAARAPTFGVEGAGVAPGAGPGAAAAAERGGGVDTGRAGEEGWTTLTCSTPWRETVRLLGCLAPICPEHSVRDVCCLPRVVPLCTQHLFSAGLQ